MKDIFEGNKAWVEQTLANDPAFFDNLAKGQSPEYLWIGCSDSRVPANEIVNMPPGSIFVQRNIANQVINSDMNLLSVVYYAVKYLKVRHIMVVGHYGCGGVAAAMSNNSFGFLDNWPVSIKIIYLKHQTELEAIEDESARVDRLVELNAIEQAKNMGKISFIQEEWQAGNKVEIHALVYSLKDGMIRDMDASIEKASDLKPVYQFNKF